MEFYDETEKTTSPKPLSKSEFEEMVNESNNIIKKQKFKKVTKADIAKMTNQ